MTAEIYNTAATVASAFWANPIMLVELTAVALALFTGLAGRLVILCEDLRYARLFGRTR